MASIPTTSVWGPKGHLVINVSDLDAWKAKGYRTTPEPAPAADPKVKGENPKVK